MFSEPAIGDRFFGRQDVLELLSRRVLALKDGYRQNVALTGQSLSGKSSIIIHFLHQIKEEGLLPIYVEVVREPFGSFVKKFIATMIFHALKLKGIDGGLDLDRLLVRAREIFPRTASAVKQVLASVENGSYDEAYTQLLGLTSVLKGEAGISCIVILDEFDNLEHLGVRNPFQIFGKVIMVQKDTMYIVTSSRNRAIKKILSEKLALLFGNFEIVTVGNFDLATAAAFIDAKTAGFDMAPATRAFLIVFTDGNPFYLDTIVTAARDAALEEMTTHIDAPAVARAITRTLYRADGRINQYLFNYLLHLMDTASRDTQFDVLAAVGGGHRTHAEVARSLKIKQADASRALASLLDTGLIIKNGSFHACDDSLMAFWLVHAWRRRKEMLVDGAIDKDALFTEDITSFMSAHTAIAGHDATGRIVELFNAFSNDLVQIDGKNIRLPHFTKVEARAQEAARPVIVASFSRTVWATQVFETPVSENDIVEHIRTLKSLGSKVAAKIIVPLHGMDENAKLLAKELKCTIWDGNTINMLLTLYGKQRIVIL